MPYPHDPPVAAAEFDYRDRQQLAAMYAWAGSAGKLARWLRMQGVVVADGTISLWRRKFGIPVAQEHYAQRGGPFSDEADPLTQPASEQTIMQLMEWLQTRKVPKVDRPKVRVNASGYATELVGCDLHYPHHHREAFEVFLGACDRIKPSGVTFNGDTLDFSQISRYRQDPRAFTPFQQDIDEARALLARVTAAAPDAARTLVMGNHEITRWENYLMTRIPEIMSLRVLDLETILDLNQVGWRYARDGYWLIEDTLVIDHGSRHTNAIGGGSAQSARKEMLDIGSSGLSGHTHKLGMFWRQDGLGYRVWAEGGCLCDQDRMRAAGVTARKRGPAREDWHLGFLRVDYKLDGESFVVTPIPIMRNKRRTFAIVNGEEIAA